MIAPLLLSALIMAGDLSPVEEHPLSEGGAIAIVTNGVAAMPIVFPERESRFRWAALYLASTIRDITGVRPDVMSDTAERVRGMATNCAVIVVGADCGACRGDGSFRVVAANGSVRFFGRADYAVFDWCERVLGVRTYPTDGKLPGKFVRSSSRRRLVVDPVDYSDSPVYATRTSTLPNKTWVRMCKPGDAHRGEVCVHAPHRWFADPAVRDVFPDIFALMPDGSRGEMPLLCYGNPQTLAYYKWRIDMHIAGIMDSGGIVDTDRHVITVSPWDVMVECQCEYCRRLVDNSLGLSGNASPIVWGWFLRLLAEWSAKAHPDYTVAFLPYLNTCLVPPRFTLADLGNCEAMLCTMPGLAMLKEPQVREREERLVGDWVRATGRKVIDWHYSCWPREFTSAPYLFGRTIVTHAMRMRDKSVGTFICGGNGGASERLSSYVWLRALWNPALDVDAIYDGFARSMFAEAAGPMRELMDMQENGWARRWNSATCNRENVFGVSYPKEDVEKMKRLLCEAAELVRNDARALSGVKWYARDFRRFFADADEFDRNPGRREFSVRRMGAEPKVDGRVGEAEWRGCEAHPLVAAFGRGGKVRRGGTVRMGWTGKGVWFAVCGEEPAVSNLNLRAAYGDLRKQDSVEFYLIGGDAPTGTCHRIMVDLRGRVSWTSDSTGWSPAGVRAAVGFGDGGWTMELFVPFKAVERNPVWLGNVVRWHAGPPSERERTRLSTLGGEWNQDRDAFAELRFTEVGSGR